MAPWVRRRATTLASVVAVAAVLGMVTLGSPQPEGLSVLGAAAEGEEAEPADQSPPGPRTSREGAGPPHGRQGPPDHAARSRKGDSGPPAHREGAGEMACTGPPPWAGTPARGVSRSQQAEAFSQWRTANCPDDAQDAEAPRAP